MNDLSVLHISDFHCASPGGSSSGNSWNETLVKNYAKSLREAFDKIGKAPYGGAVDLILATGDFVHQGHADSFSKANTFLEQFVNEFSNGSQKPDVILCPGNHDYNRDLEKSGQIINSRAGYTQFSSKWHHRITARSENLTPFEQFKKTVGSDFQGAVFVSPLDRFKGLPILSLDSTWSDISDSEQARKYGDRLHLPKPWYNDESQMTVIFEKIAEFLMNFEPEWPTIILTHYPVVIPQDIRDKRTRQSFNVDDHVSNHLKDLVEHIEVKTKHPVYVFCGDVHEAFARKVFSGDRDTPLKKLKSTQYVSGRSYQLFGSTQQTPWIAGARLTRFIRDKKSITTQSLLMKFGNDVDSTFDPSKSDWILHSDSPKKFTQKFSRSLRPILKLEAEDDVSKTALSGQSEDSTDELASDLSDYIKENKLVDLRRIKCSTPSEYSRLLQIKIGPIMSDQVQKHTLIKSLIQGFKRISSGSNNEILLIGIDCWGYSIATQLGYALGLQSVGVSVRGLDDSELGKELTRRFSQRRDLGSGCFSYCYVTDVIATGDTLNRIKAKMPSSDKVTNFGLSIVRSAFSYSNSELSSIKIASVIDRFNIPILRNSELPDEQILPSKAFGLH